VLFVDEAAQMSLANVLAVSQAARGLVLLGDPQQLDQPTQGSHPEGTDVSALTHILAGEKTIAEGQGLFLAETWRLHPDICAFTSEVFYEGRSRSREELAAQQVRSSRRVNGSGLRYLLVDHAGNQSSSVEEVHEIEALVADILGSGSTWVDWQGPDNGYVTKPISSGDILIIAPYNAQVFELQKRLPGARVGTVDKFQGQQAAIVIYSMRPQAMPTHRAEWSSCTASTGSTSRPRAPSASASWLPPLRCSKPTAARRGRCSSPMRFAATSNSPRRSEPSRGPCT
jgi:superfamily I DNA and/or RNA helicase